VPECSAKVDSHEWIEHKAYSLCYNEDSEQPEFTVFEMTKSEAKKLGSAPRRNNFRADSAVSTGSAELSDYKGSGYSRGHLIPNGSRNGIKEMQKQTFYVTNSVPQIQDNFNGGIWNNLENALQSIADSEKIYIVTGVLFSKVGESKTIKYTKAKDDTKNVPVPNYFYKVVLKVTTNGGAVTSASTIGFWFEHKTYSDSYTNYAVSVDNIEQWTGFDFFVNLPDSIEDTAETNTSWSSFQSF
jgi:endonuclease G